MKSPQRTLRTAGALAAITVATTMAACLALFAAPSSAFAQGHPPPHGHGPHYGSPDWHFDVRYHHDHYYPSIGFMAPVLPGGSLSIAWGGGTYFYHGGVWFRPYGPRFRVVVPPFGILVPVLPPAFTTLWIGGAPYYYADGAYYAPAGPEGYRVVEPPPGADDAQPMDPGEMPPGYVPPPGYQPPPGYAPPPRPRAPAPPPEPILYPRNGQGAQQMEADRQECNRWATTQRNAMADASVFQRAVTACLDGKGYTIR